MNRTALRLLALLTAGALVAAACGGDSGESASDGGTCPVDALDDADGPVEVTVWHIYAGLVLDTMKAITDEYNASQDKVKVSLENQGVAFEELLRKYRQGIPSGDLPTIGVMEDTNTQFLADSGTIVPGAACAEADGYTDYEDDFLPAVIDYYSVDGALQPTVFEVSNALLYYNRDHFEAAGLDPDAPPQTLAEVEEYARQIRDAGVVDTPLVLNMQAWYTEFWLTGAGEGLVDNENGRGASETAAGAFDNEATRELFEFFSSMQAEGLLHAVPGTEGQFDHYFALGLEQASMGIEASSAVTTINGVLEGNVDPADLGLEQELPPIDINLDAGAFPGLDGPNTRQFGGGVWYITNTGSPEEQAAAWDFAKFVNTPENQALMHVEGSQLPVRQQAIESPEVEVFWTDTRAGQWLKIATDELESVDPDWPGPLIGPFTETRDAVRTALDGLLFGDESVDEAIATADQTITDALTQYNEENF